MAIEEGGVGVTLHEDRLRGVVLKLSDGSPVVEQPLHAVSIFILLLTTTSVYMGYGTLAGICC